MCGEHSAPTRRTMRQSSADLLLDADAAWTCPVKTRNRFDETVVVPTRSDSRSAGRADLSAVTELTSASGEARKRVLDALAGWPGAVDLRPRTDRPTPGRNAAAATVEAVGRCAPLIVSPRLPDDPAGHRTGSPDILVLESSPDGATGYRPVILARHRVLQSTGGEHTLEASMLRDLGGSIRLPGIRLRTGREADLLRLAHYWRILQALGWQASGAPVAGVIGTDRIDTRPGRGRGLPGNSAAAQTSHAGDVGWRLVHAGRGGIIRGGEPLIAWADLDARMVRTFARTAERGWRLHSALERYDHEFGFRLHVARLAMTREPNPDTPEPGVRPVVTEECETCRWWPACRPRLDKNDLSLRIDKARLDAREISVLAAMGISTIDQLAAADLDALAPDYLPEVSHRSGAEQRLRLAARRASLLVHGEQLQRTTSGPLELPPPGWSIDLDIETSVRDRVYLWGFLVNDPQDPAGSHYVHFSRFSVLDEAAEQELAEQAMGWLATQLSAHPGARVYHYSDFEVVHIRRIAAASGLPGTVRVARHYTRSSFFDLFPVVRRNFFGAHGLGLKALAQYGAGFNWRDEEPGGLNSQHWFAAAVTAEDEEKRRQLRRRVLEYNEDDTRATRELRAWLRSLD